MKKQEAIELQKTLGDNFQIVSKDGHFKVVEIEKTTMAAVVEAPATDVDEPVVFKSIRLMKEALAKQELALPARDLPFLNATFPERTPGTKERWNFTQTMVDRVVKALEAKKN